MNKINEFEYKRSLYQERLYIISIEFNRKEIHTNLRVKDTLEIDGRNLLFSMKINKTDNYF